ncbi:MAG TPA: glucose-6-phosphate isomerase [Jatrophihabitans sp.]|jgi:glucose-6-phosphate isomerase|uniref:glucose-6-phosphate isomerase n=1 Tax=Jatrophihabitans sp. TaxID=1932789 RepID=UPI002F1CF179
MTETASTNDDVLRLEPQYPDVGSYTDALNALVHDQVASRIAAQDPTLWGADAESEAAKRLSWVSLALTSRPLIAQIAALREELAAEGVDHVVLAGMGGSSLAPEVICATAGVALVTLDTTDPGQVRVAIADSLQRTVLVVSSKSGGTVETDSHRRAYEQAFTEQGIDPRRRIVVVTDPGSPLQQAAEEAGYRKVFLADPNVGGRYSALTAFGLVPSGLAGVDLTTLLDEAGEAAEALSADSAANPGLRLGALLGQAHNSSSDGTGSNDAGSGGGAGSNGGAGSGGGAGSNGAGCDKVVFADFGSGIVGFGDWAEQLIAESTGKDGRGLLPVVVEGPDAPGFADAGPDAILISLGGDRQSAEPASGWGAAVSGPLGGQLLLWEYATAIAGRIIGINPFDQPNVEEAKKQARALLDAPEQAGKDEPALTDGAVQVFGAGFDLAGASTLADALRAFLAAAPERGYVSVQAYLDRHADTEALELRPALARRTGLQTTFGWGPRFLHSTGQYHKGGHPNGVFLQLTGDISAEAGGDLEVPDRPYTFASLQHAQAAGDATVLADKGRPVLHLHLTDRAAGIQQLLQAL